LRYITTVRISSSCFSRLLRPFHSPLATGALCPVLHGLRDAIGRRSRQLSTSSASSLRPRKPLRRAGENCQLPCTLTTATAILNFKWVIQPHVRDGSGRKSLVAPTKAGASWPCRPPRPLAIRVAKGRTLAPGPRAARSYRTNLVYTVFVKNITLSADENLIEQARKAAAERHTTLNAAFREWLEQYSAAPAGSRSTTP